MRAELRKMFSGTSTAGRIVAACLTLTACSDPETRIDELFADYDGAARPGAAVLVIRDGARELTKTYGVADIATKEPITEATNFRLASLSKQFTATAVLMLVDEGRFTLDSTLAEIFPASGDAAAPITVRQLLSHQSGLPDYEPLVPADGDQVHDADVLALMLATERLDFEPGSAYHYSNSGYAVLAMIVERVSGQRFADFLDERIFTPVGMAGTVAFERGVSKVPNRAFGYTVTETGVDFTDQSVWSAVLGDGGVYSSLDDLYRWDQALYRDELISAELKAAMLTPGLENYGFGWRIDSYDGERRYHHSGSTSGFRNFIQRFPDKRLTVVVLTNRAGPDVQPLAERVADLYL